MTVHSSEPLPPTAGPSGSRVGEISTPTETVSTKLSSVLRSLSPTGEIALPPSEADCELQGTGLVQLSGLRTAAVHIKCPGCESELQFCEGCEGRHGLFTYMYMSFQCTMCSWEACITDPGVPSSTILNTRVVSVVGFVAWVEVGWMQFVVCLGYPLCSAKKL